MDDIVARRQKLFGMAPPPQEPAPDNTSAMRALIAKLNEAEAQVDSLTAELAIANQRAHATQAECTRLAALADAATARAGTAEAACAVVGSERDDCNRALTDALVARATQETRAQAAEEALAFERARPAPAMPVMPAMPEMVIPAPTGWVMRVTARGPNGEIREIKSTPEI